MEHFRAAPQADINSSTLSRPRHAVFHSFLSDDSKQDAATTAAHSKRLISLLKNKQVLTISLSTIWENTDGCSEQYICASALYLMSVCRSGLRVPIAYSFLGSGVPIPEQRLY